MVNLARNLGSLTLTLPGTSALSLSSRGREDISGKVADHDTIRERYRAMTGNGLRRIRRRLGLTQVEFAEQLGLHPNTVARQERGEVGIGRAVASLARLLSENPKLLRRKPRRA